MTLKSELMFFENHLRFYIFRSGRLDREQTLGVDGWFYTGLVELRLVGAAQLLIQQLFELVVTGCLRCRLHDDSSRKTHISTEKRGNKFGYFGIS